jgi:hypothetical protein
MGAVQVVGLQRVGRPRHDSAVDLQDRRRHGDGVAALHRAVEVDRSAVDHLQQQWDRLGLDRRRRRVRAGVPRRPAGGCA